LNPHSKFSSSYLGEVPKAVGVLDSVIKTQFRGEKL